jgi:hypothetical protein
VSYVALGLFILACGWNVYRDFTPTRSRAIRIEGHPQYFGAALAAGYVFALGICLHHAASRNTAYVEAVHSIATITPREEKPAERGATSSESIPGGTKLAGVAPRKDEFERALAVTLWSGLLAIGLPFLLNAPFWANRRLTHLTTYDDLEEVERMLVDAVQRGVGVAITLANRKFYVGMPLETSQDGTSDTQWIRIRPLASGYRGVKGAFQFTTAYSAVYSELLSDDDETRGPDDFCVALPISQIISIQNFDLDLYTRRFASDATSSDPELSEALKEVIEKEEGDLLIDEVAVLPQASAAADITLGPVAVSATATVAPTRLEPTRLPNWLLLALQWSFHGAITAVTIGLAFSTPLACIGVVVAVVAFLCLWVSSGGRATESSSTSPL